MGAAWALSRGGGRINDGDGSRSATRLRPSRGAGLARRVAVPPPPPPRRNLGASRGAAPRRSGSGDLGALEALEASRRARGGTARAGPDRYDAAGRGRDRGRRADDDRPDDTPPPQTRRAPFGAPTRPGDPATP